MARRKKYQKKKKRKKNYAITLRGEREGTQKMVSKRRGNIRVKEVVQERPKENTTG